MPRLAILILAIFVVVTGSVVVTAYYAMQRPPRFYQQALNVPMPDYRVAGDQFERAIIELSNQIRYQPNWSAEFSATEINGWIATDLPEKFPETLPEVISEPRIAIENDQLELAFRVISPRFRGVVHIRGNVFCTDRHNQIAFQLSKISSGFVSIPISFWADRIQDSLNQKGIVLTWTEYRGDPVALVTLPNDLSCQDAGPISIDSITLHQGQLQIAGSTKQLAPATALP